MSEVLIEQRFVARLRELLLSLPYDVKVLQEAMADEDLALEARRAAAAGVVYCISRADAIPEAVGALGYVDDVVVVRLALSEVSRHAGPSADDYATRFAEQFGPLSGDLELLASQLGDSLRWVERRFGRIRELKYKGKSIEDYVQGESASQRLYDESLRFATEYEVDDAVVAKIATGRQVLNALRVRQSLDEARR